MNALAAPSAAPSRREVLVASLALGTVLLVGRPLRADPDRARARRAVVLLHLRGGNDGLNTVVPAQRAAYRRLRPSLAVPDRAVLALDDGLGLHPALEGLHTLWTEHRLAVVNGVGYPNPDFSHFRSLEIWHTARPDRTSGEGWLGLALRARDASGPVTGVAFDRHPPQCLSGAGPGVLTLRDFRALRLPRGLRDVETLYRASAHLPRARGVVGRAGRDGLAAAREIASLKPADGAFTGRLGEDLRRALALLDARLGVEVIHLAFDGFDTHANQREPHANLLRELGTNLRAFQEGLDARGLGARVVTVVYSEFGRRAAENLSGGTDHGAAAPLFVIGDGVRHGLHGPHPRLDDLDDGNLRFTTDFRRVYAALLRDALVLDPSPILGSFPPLELLS